MTNLFLPKPPDTNLLLYNTHPNRYTTLQKKYDRISVASSGHRPVKASNKIIAYQKLGNGSGGGKSSFSIKLASIRFATSIQEIDQDANNTCAGERLPSPHIKQRRLQTTYFQLIALFVALTSSTDINRQKRGLVEVIDHEYGYGTEEGAILAPTSGLPVPNLEYGVIALVSSPIPADAPPVQPEAEAVGPPHSPIYTEEVVPSHPFIIQSGLFIHR